MNTNREILKKSLPGFTLIELSIVLIVIGLIAAGVFKASGLIESAQMQSVLTDFQRHRLSILMYKDQYNEWPTDTTWKDLYNAGLSTTPTTPSAKIGGVFSIKIEPNKPPYLVLSQSARTLVAGLTPHQARQLKNKAGESEPDKGLIKILDGEGLAVGKCIKDGTYNLQETGKTCVVLMTLEG